MNVPLKLFKEATLRVLAAMVQKLEWKCWNSEIHQEKSEEHGEDDSVADWRRSWTRWVSGRRMSLCWRGHRWNPSCRREAGGIGVVVGSSTVVIAKQVE